MGAAAADSMEFESILVSKALPDGRFSQKAVIDTHRTFSSIQCSWPLNRVSHFWDALHLFLYADFASDCYSLPSLGSHRSSAASIFLRKTQMYLRV